MLISRAEAKLRGLKFYSMSRPCNRGHLGERYTSNQMCKACTEINGATRYQENKDEIKAAANVWAKQNIVHKRATRRAAYAANPRKFLDRNKSWHQKFPAKNTAKTQRYNARKRKAYPKWLTPKHEAEMLAQYEQARRLSKLIGIEYEVDHTVPLGGALVCGLHVPWNLQIIPAWENRSKSNQHGAN